MTSLPDPAADPAGYVTGKSAEVEEAAREIAGESPALSVFVLAQVALWRGVAKRHQRNILRGPESVLNPNRCQWCNDSYPCPDLTDVVAACQAYAGGP